MRLLSRISAAFLLLDGYDKQPLLGASILADGARRKYISKGDGHYVFLNLEPAPHEFEISVPGFKTVRKSVPYPPGTLPMVLPLQYDGGSAKIRSMPHFRFVLEDNGKPVKNALFSLVLETPVAALRVIEDAGEGAYALGLSGGFNRSMLYQEYDCGGLKLLLKGYDKAGGRYELLELLKEPIKQGGLLRPRWELETDGNGAAVLPVMGSFMQKDEIEFSAALSSKEQRLRLGPPGSGEAPVLISF